VPYRNGGDDPSGFDWSGFVQFILARFGQRVPRATREQFGAGRSVDKDDIKPGDLVFFTTVAPGASHVGIALDGDEFVHAPNSRGVVRVESLNTAYWRTRFIGARRVGGASGKDRR
jgi:cell wall-associated NlpC family hydrolase